MRWAHDAARRGGRQVIRWDLDWHSPAADSDIECGPLPGATIRPTEWVRRYGIAELAGTCAALATAHAAYILSGSELAAAGAGTVGEGVGFYGAVVIRDVSAHRRAIRAAGRRYRTTDAGRTAMGLLVEFGPAELADSTLIRPLAMAAGVRLLGLQWGILIGKLAADLLFYLTVMSARELGSVVARFDAGRREGGV